MISRLAPPLGLEEVVQTLEKTLKRDGGGNAGGNISDDERMQLAEWAAFYGRISGLCKALQRRAD